MNTTEPKITLKELFIITWRIYKDNFLSIIIINFIVFITLNSITFLINHFWGKSSFGFVFDIVKTLISLVGSIAYLAIVFMVNNILAERPVITLKQSLQFGLKRCWPAITTGILQYIIVFLLMLLFIIPGVIWMVYYTFIYQVLALKDLKWKEALNYSKYIVRGNWWKVFGNLFALAFIPGLIYFVMFKLYNNFIAIDPRFKSLIIPINTISNIFSSFVTIGTTILFVNIENVKLNSDNETNLNLYAKMNRFVNKDIIIDSQVDDLEEIEYEEDENTLRCSVCGISVDPDKLICPMCRSVIRHNTQTGEDKST